MRIKTRDDVLAALADRMDAVDHSLPSEYYIKRLSINLTLEDAAALLYGRVDTDTEW